MKFKAPIRGFKYILHYSRYLSVASFLMGWVVNATVMLVVLFPRISCRGLLQIEGKVAKISLNLGDMSEDVCAVKGGGLSPATIRYIHVRILAALKQAVKERLLVVNPAEAVELPKDRPREMKTLKTQ